MLSVNFAFMSTKCVFRNPLTFCYNNNNNNNNNYNNIMKIMVILPSLDLLFQSVPI